MYAAVYPGATPTTAREQLTKLANERFEELAWINVDEENWSIRSESWNLAKLQQPERKHPFIKLPQFDGPIIVVEFRNRELLVDGTHRVNYWSDRGQSIEREVLIIQYANSDT